MAPPPRGSGALPRVGLAVALLAGGIGAGLLPYGVQGDTVRRLEGLPGWAWAVAPLALPLGVLALPPRDRRMLVPAALAVLVGLAGALQTGFRFTFHLGPPVQLAPAAYVLLGLQLAGIVAAAALAWRRSAP